MVNLIGSSSFTFRHQVTNIFCLLFVYNSTSQTATYPFVKRAACPFKGQVKVIWSRSLCCRGMGVIFCTPSCQIVQGVGGSGEWVCVCVLLSRLPQSLKKGIVFFEAWIMPKMFNFLLTPHTSPDPLPEHAQFCRTPGGQKNHPPILLQGYDLKNHDSAPAPPLQRC